MRSRMIPFLFIGFMLTILVIMVLVAVTHAQPVTVIGPHGQVTVIYPGTNGGPSVILPPTGQPAFVYPGGMSPAPIVLPPTVTLPPVFVIPAPMAPMGGGW